MAHRVFAVSAVVAAAIVWFAAPAAADLRICNETEHIQAISIGYHDDDRDAWVSEGWWNVKPDECATVVGGDLTRQFYYYRAEIDGGDFDGEGYFFCTTPKEYTIIGDEECGDRGYDREDFREIDTGPTSRGHTLTLRDPGAPEPDPPAPAADDEGKRQGKNTRNDPD